MTDSWLQAQAKKEAARRWLEMMSCPRYREALERLIGEEIVAYHEEGALDDETPSKSLPSTEEARPHDG